MFSVFQHHKTQEKPQEYTPPHKQEDEQPVIQVQQKEETKVEVKIEEPDKLLPDTEDFAMFGCEHLHVERALLGRDRSRSRDKRTRQISDPEENGTIW